MKHLVLLALLVTACGGTSTQPSSADGGSRSLEGDGTALTTDPIVYVMTDGAGPTVDVLLSRPVDSLHVSHLQDGRLEELNPAGYRIYLDDHSGRGAGPANGLYYRVSVEFSNSYQVRAISNGSTFTRTVTVPKANPCGACANPPMPVVPPQPVLLPAACDPAAVAVTLVQTPNNVAATVGIRDGYEVRTPFDVYVSSYGSPAAFGIEPTFPVERTHLEVIHVGGPLTAADVHLAARYPDLVGWLAVATCAELPLTLEAMPGGVLAQKLGNVVR